MRAEKRSGDERQYDVSDRIARHDEPDPADTQNAKYDVLLTSPHHPRLMLGLSTANRSRVSVRPKYTTSCRSNGTVIRSSVTKTVPCITSAVESPCKMWVRALCHMPMLAYVLWSKSKQILDRWSPFRRTLWSAVIRITLLHGF